MTKKRKKALAAEIFRFTGFWPEKSQIQAAKREHVAAQAGKAFGRNVKEGTPHPGMKRVKRSHRHLALEEQVAATRRALEEKAAMADSKSDRPFVD